MFNTFTPFAKSGYPSYDCREDCRLECFENVSADDYKKYISALKNEGFVSKQERELFGNSFATLVRENLAVTMYLTPCDGTLRITVQQNASLPGFSPTECDMLCRSSFYCFENDHSMIDCGMCLLLQCSDYSFFVIDSGHYFQMNDNDRIYRFMRERTPEGQKIIISGWLITHAHTDHISKLMDFLIYNCDDVIIEGFYSNLLPNDYPSEWDNEETGIAGKLFRMLESHNAPKIKLHSGQHFYIRNLEIDVLGTHEDIYPEIITDYNDSSCIITVTVDGTKIFIPGDASVLASKRLEERYGNNLKSDIVQVSHHGHRGLSSSAYELIDAKLALFPITRIKFDEEYPVIEANRRLIELADEYYISSDGTIEVPLPYKKGNVICHDDESFEDFEKIRRLWGYEYTPERKKELLDLYQKNGGNLDNIVLPVDGNGYCAETKWRK